MVEDENAAAGTDASDARESGAHQPRTAEALLAAARRRAAAEAGKAGPGARPVCSPPRSYSAHLPLGRARVSPGRARSEGSPGCPAPSARVRSNIAQARALAASALKSGAPGGLAFSPPRKTGAPTGGQQRSEAALVSLHARCRSVQHQLEEVQEQHRLAEERAAAAEADAAALRLQAGALEETLKLDAHRQDGAQRGLEGQLLATQERARSLEQRAQDESRASALKEAEQAREAAALATEARRLAAELHAAQEANRGGAAQLAHTVGEVERLRTALSEQQRARVTAEQSALAARSELQRASAGMQAQELQLQELVRRAKVGMAEQLATAKSLLEAAAQRCVEAATTVTQEAEQRANGLQARLEAAEEQLCAVEALRVSEGETLELAMEWSEIINGRMAELSEKVAELRDALTAGGSDFWPGGSTSAARQKDGKVKRKKRKADRAAAAARQGRISQLAQPKRAVRMGKATAGAAGTTGAKTKKAMRKKKPAHRARLPSPSQSPTGKEVMAGPVGFSSGAVRLTPAPEDSPLRTSPGARLASRPRASRHSGAEGPGGKPSREGLQLLEALQGELEELSQAHGNLMGVFESRGFVSTSPGRSAIERQLEGVGTLRDLQGLASSIQSKVEQVKTLRQHLISVPAGGRAGGLA